MKYFLPTLLFFFSSLPAFAHLGKLAGTVYNKATNLPLRGVTVQLTGSGKATITNELGNFRFTELVAAPYKLEFSHIGFSGQVAEVVVKDDQTTTVTVSLASAPVELSEVVVS